jgi:hypothetical protein
LPLIDVLELLELAATGRNSIRRYWIIVREQIPGIQTSIAKIGQPNKLPANADRPDGDREDNDRNRAVTNSDGND